MGLGPRWGSLWPCVPCQPYARSELWWHMDFICRLKISLKSHYRHYYYKLSARVKFHVFMFLSLSEKKSFWCTSISMNIEVAETALKRLALDCVSRSYSCCIYRTWYYTCHYRVLTLLTRNASNIERVIGIYSEETLADLTWRYNSLRSISINWDNPS